MKIIVTLSLIICFISSCKHQESGGGVDSLTSTSSANASDTAADEALDQFGQYSLASAVAYGIELVPKFELTVNPGQLVRLPRIDKSQGQGSYCELEGDKNGTVNYYPEETYGLFEVEGSDFTGNEFFNVSVQGEKSRAANRLNCFNFPKQSKDGSVLLVELVNIISDEFSVQFIDK